VPQAEAFAGGMADDERLQRVVQECAGHKVDLDVNALTRGKLSDTIRVHYIRELRRCYETALAAHPGLSARVLLHATIRPDGTLTNLRVEGPLPSLSQCIRDVVGVLSKSRFPKRKEPLSFTYPLTFGAD
jgi:hypothetical protein